MYIQRVGEECALTPSKLVRVSVLVRTVMEADRILATRAFIGAVRERAATAQQAVLEATEAVVQLVAKRLEANLVSAEV